MKNLAKLDIKMMTTADRFLQDTFFTTDSKRALIVNHEQNAILYYIAPEAWEDLASVRVEMMELFEIINLLKYLKEQRYLDIFTTPTPLQKVQAMYSGINETSKKEAHKYFLNKDDDYIDTRDFEKIKNSNGIMILRGMTLSDYYTMVYENCFGLIFPNEAFYDLVNNNFESTEDRKHNQNIFLAKAGIFIAIILGLIGIAMQVLDNGNQKTNSLIEETNKILHSNGILQEKINLKIDTNTSKLSDIKNLISVQKNNDSIVNTDK